MTTPTSHSNSALVQQSREGDVLVLTINNPPVNAFSPGVPEGLHAGLDVAEKDDSLKAVVIMGGGRTFIAGADIKTFNLPRSEAPDLRGFISRLDQFPKPTVAAIHGTALGGGFEVALACNYRVAAPDAKMGLPEVKLGVLPGAGGTQRLPRLIGADKALVMMLTGNPIDAAEAASLGIVNELVTGDLKSGAVKFAHEHAAQRPLPRVSEGKVPETALVPGGNMKMFMDIRKNLKKTHAGLLSPTYIVDLVEIATTKAFSDGWAAEARLFVMAKDSPQSRALRHLFFADRERSKVAGITKETPVKDIKKVGVIGAGTMGSGIAMNFLNAGLPVVILETTHEALERGLSGMLKNYEASVAKGRLTREQMEARLELLTPALDMEALADADLIVEAAFESMEVKKDIFGKLAKIARPDAILATNTSTLDINEIAAVTGRPQQVLGLHFFSPAHIMKLLEIVRGEKTSDTVLATAFAISKKIGKIGVVVGVGYGFVGNRMLVPYREQARRMVLEGAHPQDVDAAMHALGLPMGPFEMGDMAGMDIGYASRREAAKKAGITLESDWLDHLVEMGRLGQKTGGGVYDYPEGRKPVPSHTTEGVIARARVKAGIVPRTFTPEEITKRLAYGLANEGAHILEEGIAARSSDIDVIYVNGYGFPAYRGGPMQYASEQGLAQVVKDLESFGMKPAPLLKRLAAEGKTFADYDAGHTSR